MRQERGSENSSPIPVLHELESESNVRLNVSSRADGHADKVLGRDGPPTERSDDGEGCFRRSGGNDNVLDDVQAEHFGVIRVRFEAASERTHEVGPASSRRRRRRAGSRAARFGRLSRDRELLRSFGGESGFLELDDHFVAQFLGEKVDSNVGGAVDLRQVDQQRQTSWKPLDEPG